MSCTQRITSRTRPQLLKGWATDVSADCSGHTSVPSMTPRKFAKELRRLGADAR